MKQTFRHLVALLLLILLSAICLTSCFGEPKLPQMYTTNTVFMVDVRDKTGNSSSATTEYYEIQKAKENARELVYILGINTTIHEAMKNGHLGTEGGPTLEEVNAVKDSMMFSVDTTDLPLVRMTITTTSPDLSIQYTRCFEEQLPLLFEKGSMFEQKNICLTVVKTAIEFSE